MFARASAFNQALNEWNVASVTDMQASECLVCWPILAAAGSRVFFYIADNPFFSLFPVRMLLSLPFFSVFLRIRFQSAGRRLGRGQCHEYARE